MKIGRDLNKLFLRKFQRYPFVTPKYPLPSRMAANYSNEMTKQEADRLYAEALAQVGGEPPQVDREQRQFTSLQEASDFARVYGKELHPMFKYLVTQPRFEQKTAEWLEARRGALTASVFGAACNHAEYGNPLSLFQDKCTTFPEPIRAPMALEAMAWGVKYEDAATHRFEQETGHIVYDFGLLMHWELVQMKPEHTPMHDWYRMVHSEERPESITAEQWSRICDLRWLKGSPDGITEDGHVIEIKCPFSEYDPDHIKDMYMWQLLLNMAIAGADKGYFIQYRPREGVFFSEQYSCVEIEMPPGWFEEERKKAYELCWSKIEHFKRTGTIPAPFDEKITLVPNLPDGEVKFESKRKRRSTSKANVGAGDVVRRRVDDPGWTFRCEDDEDKTAAPANDANKTEKEKETNVPHEHAVTFDIK